MAYARNLRALSWYLARWSVSSIIVGTALTFLPSPFWRGFAVQALLCGAICLVLALWGLIRAGRFAAALPDEERDVRHTLRLRTLLIVSTRIDVIYLLAGITVAVLFRGTPFLMGTGIGIIPQALFLLYFDASGARRLPAEAPPWYHRAP